MACTEYSSDLTSGETFDASGVFGGYPLANAFDDALSNEWATDNAGDRWVEVEFATAQQINRVRVYNRTFHSYMPSQVTCRASNTGAFAGEETTLFTSASGLTWSNPEWKSFDFENSNSFSFYRLYFVSIDSEFLVVAEFEMMECTAESAEIEGDLSDGAAISDSVDAFNLTDGIADAAALGDSVDGFSTSDELVDAALLGDSTDRYAEKPGSIVDAAGLGDSADGFNFTSWFNANRDRSVVRYYCTLTGANDGLSDLSIPIGSFQARKRSGESTYLSVVVPGMALADSIADRLNGELVIYMAYLLDGVESLREEILRVDLEQINPSIGTRSRSITLIGHRTVTYDARAASIQGASYKYENDGLLGFRFPQADPYLNPGDALTVIDTNDVFTVDYITYAISARGAKFMEVREG